MRTPDRLRENLDVVDIVIGFLSSGGGKPEKSLGEYVDRVLKMKRRPFSQKVTKIDSYIGFFFLVMKITRKKSNNHFWNMQAREYCRLQHILSLWEVLSVELAKLTWLQEQVRGLNVKVIEMGIINV